MHKILYYKQTKYYVMLWSLPCVCDAPTVSKQNISQWGIPNDYTHFLENLQIKKSGRHKTLYDYDFLKF